MAPRAEILTIGHSNHQEAEFLDLLRQADVKLVADVRANPRSRYPQFNRSDLAESLKEAGIRYVHLGAQLGGRRQSRPDSVNVGVPDGAFRGYADHMQSDVFDDGLTRLEELAVKTSTTGAAGAAGLTAVMCAEADWRHCHRRLIADALEVRGWRVLHLGPNGSLESHQLTEAALVDGERISYPERQTSLGL